jgi:septal ring factor EnvC (AmiA/AmiB activator)
VIAAPPPSDAVDTTARLRRQRNIFAVAAVATMLLMLALTLPTHLQNHRALKRTNEEIVQLQAAIGTRQTEIRQVQAAITAAQQEITSLTRP